MIRRILLAAAVCTFPLHALRAEDAEPTPTPVQISAAETDAIKVLAGKLATVEGKVHRVGKTEAGGITFINLSGDRGGFVAVVFKSNYEAFPDGFDKYKDQTIRVTGKVELFKETTPEIVVKSPDQIEIVPTPEPSATP